LIGQCFLEREPIHLKDMPEDFETIETGLGAATPKEVLLYPLNYNNQTVGVIELASLSQIGAAEKELIKRTCETLAVALLTIESNRTMQQLLQSTQTMSEQMREQEENLRQNIEELQATQEEMERNREELLEKEVSMQGIIDTTEDVILALDPNYRVLACNNACAERFSNMGIQLEEGVDFLHSLNKKSQEHSKPLYDRALAGERFINWETFEENGKPVYLETHYNPICNPQGSVFAIGIISYDVTKWVNQEYEMKELIESKQESSAFGLH
jgi:PAS domain-containing protein